MTGRAIEFQSLPYLPVVAIAAVACAVAFAALYRTQLRSAARGWRWVVPAFRVLAVVVLLASVLKPSVRRPARPEDLGDLLLVVGQSPSMSAADQSWTPAERVAIAAALGELPPKTSRWSGRQLLDEVRRVRPLIDQAARAASELDAARAAGRETGEHRRRASQARTTLVQAMTAIPAKATGAPDPVRATVQWTDVADLIDAKGAAAWAELRTRTDAAAAAIQAGQSQSDAALYTSSAEVRAAADRFAQSTRTELARRVADRILRPLGFRDAPQSGRPIRAAVLLGDGREVPPLPGGAPVFATAVTPATIRDVAIRDIAVPPIAYAGDPVTVRVELSAVGVDAPNLSVRLSSDNTTQTIQTAIRPDGTAAAQFPVTFASPGTITLSATVDPLDAEATRDNNTTDRRVRVMAERSPAVVVQGAAAVRSDSVRDALAAVPGVAARVETVDQPWDLRPTDRLLILDDVAAGLLSADQLDAINELVTERGGTLVLVAGRMNWPLDAESESLLADYLPYPVPSGWQAWRVATGRPATPPDLSVAIELPSVRRYVHFGDLKPAARVRMTEQETGAPLAIESTVGRGRVLTIAAETIGDRAEVERFWTGLMRHVADRPFAVHSGQYALDTDSPDIPAGTPLKVRAKVPLTAPATLLLTRDGRTLRTESVTAASGGTWSATLSNLPPGEYDLALSTATGDDLHLPLRVRSPRQRDLGDVTPDLASLKRLADSTGGQALPLADVDLLPELLLRGRDDRPAVIEYPLWHSPYLFLFVTACLTTEWALRKRLGLA